ncbi:MAG: methyltransferase [Gammaproteobacteria bacterium]|nr:methyltransferase [Gammaproteobacteria bacterium]
MQTLQSPLGSFELARYPLQANEPLRAWDAADEYLLQQFTEQYSDAFSGRLLILNDGFGALSVALSEYAPVMCTDSWLAHQGCLVNLQHNGLAEQNVTILNSLQPPQGEFDLVLIKLPKSQAMLEHQLHGLRAHLKKDAVIIAAGMAKVIHTSTLKLFERILGPTKTSLAKKKARLIFCQQDPALEPGESPYPKHYLLEIGDTEYTITNHANVFSRESLDIGTRFFLENMPEGEYQSIVDLGCGNGILGLVAAMQNPQARLSFIDESYMAVASAEENFQRVFEDIRQAEFIVSDCMSSVATASADLTLLNPPFHQQHAVGDHVAWQMFNDAKRVLRQHGELWVIGNRHLAYHVKLKHLFGNCQTMASNKKFVLLKTKKR